MESFNIHSVSSRCEIIFSAHDNDQFLVELRDVDLFARAPVWEDNIQQSLNSLFVELARYDRPWNGSKEWKALEGELSISVTCTTLGHVFFQITLLQGGSWQVSTSIESELGQLASIAEQSQAFFARKSA